MGGPAPHLDRGPGPGGPGGWRLHYLWSNSQQHEVNLNAIWIIWWMSQGSRVGRGFTWIRQDFGLRPSDQVKKKVWRCVWGNKSYSDTITVNVGSGSSISIKSLSKKISKLSKSKDFLSIEIQSNLKGYKIGSSVCCSGICLTVTSFSKNKFSADISKETLEKTNAKFWKKGTLLNLEIDTFIDFATDQIRA